MMQTVGGAGPVVVCDFCGERIERASEANYEWYAGDHTPGVLHDVYFLHKKCVRSHEQKVGKQLDSMEMNVLPPYLVDNLQVDWEESKKHAEMMSEEIG